MNVLVLSGTNHKFNESADVINGFLGQQDDLSVTLDDNKDVLTSDGLNDFDVLVHGSGFTQSQRVDGQRIISPNFTPEQEEGLFNYVSSGKGIVGIHGTAWWIGGKAVDLIGGSANWHPPGLTFTVNIADEDHEITDGVGDFEVEDEIYMSAWDPSVKVLATADWSDKQHPMAWVKPYGDGRVFYTTLGHGPGTFERAGMQQLVTQGVRWAGKN